MVCEHTSGTQFGIGRRHIIGFRPTRQIDQRDVETQGRVRQLLGEAHLQRVGNGFGAPIEMLDLCPRIAQHDRPAPALFLIIIVESHVGNQSRGTHRAQSRVNRLEVRATCPSRGERIAVARADNHIARGELAQIGTVLIGFEHRAVTDALSEKARGVAKSKTMHILCARPQRPVRKRSDGETELTRRDIGQQSRVVLRKGRIVIGHAVAFAAERGHMRRNGQSQHIIGRRTLLRRCTKHRQEEEEEN